MLLLQLWMTPKFFFGQILLPLGSKPFCCQTFLRIAQQRLRKYQLNIRARDSKRQTQSFTRVQFWDCSFQPPIHLKDCKLCPFQFASEKMTFTQFTKGSWSHWYKIQYHPILWFYVERTGVPCEHKSTCTRIYLMGFCCTASILLRWHLAVHS